MTKNQNVLSLTLTISMLASLFLIASFPQVSSAATYAYIDTEGVLKEIEATDWMSALTTAPNIHMNSGVMLLSESN